MKKGSSGFGKGQFSKLGFPFKVPNIVRHPHKGTPKRDPNLVQLPICNIGALMNRLGFRVYRAPLKGSLHPNLDNYPYRTLIWYPKPSTLNPTKRIPG